MPGMRDMDENGLVTLYDLGEKPGEQKPVLLKRRPVDAYEIMEADKRAGITRHVFDLPSAKKSEEPETAAVADAPGKGEDTAGGQKEAEEPETASKASAPAGKTATKSADKKEGGK